MATQFDDTTADHKWSTAGNWSAGLPDAADAVTVGAAVTALNIDDTATCLSFNGTGPTNPITISGSGALTVAGAFTLDSGVTWTHTGGITLNLDAAATLAFAGVDMSADVITMNMTPAAARTYALTGASTFGQFDINMLAERRDCLITLANDISIGTSSWLGGGTGADNPTIRPLIRSSAIGTARTITIANTKTLTATDIDIQDLAVAGTGTWTDTRVGDCGGNTAGMCSAPKTVYADLGSTAGAHAYENIWSTQDGSGERDGSGINVNNYPLPQDTAIIDNYTWDVNVKSVYIDFPRMPNIDSSGLTTGTYSIYWGIGNTSTAYGNITLTGAGMTTLSGTNSIINFDARVRNEASVPLVVNTILDIGSCNFIVNSYGGSVQLGANLSVAYPAKTVTLILGTLDLNGYILSTNVFSSSNANTRVLQDTAGGGKITIYKLTGTGIDLSTDTGLTISNAPDITNGTDLTLTAAVTYAFGSTAKTFGDLTFRNHAGNFAYIITGFNNVFGLITPETPDVTYQYNSVTWPAHATLGNTVADYDATGHADYDCFIQSSDAATPTPAHLTRSGAGTCTFVNCTINDMHVAIGTWDATSGCTDGGGNEGWTWPAGGLEIPVDDTINLSDAMYMNFGFKKADSLSLSDIISKKPGFKKADSINLSDGVSRAPWLSKSDTISLSEIPKKGIGVNKSDSISLADNIIKLFGFSKADAISISDGIAKLSGLSKSDSIALADNITREIGLIKADSITLEDLIHVVLAGIIYKSLSDTINLSDIYAAEVGLKRADSITMSDLLVKGFGLNKADSLSLMDAITKEFGLTESDTINLTDRNDISGIVLFIIEQLGLHPMEGIF